MLNRLTCHITHSGDSVMTFPLMTAFAVCFKVDKTVLCESYTGSVPNTLRPFPLHRVYWIRPLIVWYPLQCQAAGLCATGARGEGEALLCQGTRLEVMARQLSPELMKVCLIAWSAAKLLPAWSKSKAWNGHMSLTEAHLQAEGCRGGSKKKNNSPWICLSFCPSFCLSFHEELETGNHQWKRHTTLHPQPWKRMQHRCVLRSSHSHYANWLLPFALDSFTFSLSQERELRLALWMH